MTSIGSNFYRYFVVSTGLVYCLVNPCVRGRCVELPDGYECVCSKGWEGINCTSSKYKHVEVISIGRVFLSTTCFADGPWVSGIYRVGSYQDPDPQRGKEVTVVFDRCYTGVAEEVTATATGELRYSDTFRVQIGVVFAWGFTATVHRTDISPSGWAQQGVELQWKAFFGERGTSFLSLNKAAILKIF